MATAPNSPRVKPEWPDTVRTWALEVVKLQREIAAKAREFNELDMMDPGKPNQMYEMGRLHRELSKAYTNLAKEQVYHLSRKRGGNHGSQDEAGSDDQGSGGDEHGVEGSTS